ncbi:hypothetical protein MC7420_6878 [Coleofasciculus chthonoplastes PCC 7420]|uniref:Uncharacterized protein n=1 Tax=Coleofasciculus chthonoplastes PCC 7420 TaxID=118168 RepID=B4W1Z6_9CYAN|nr:hypothetical protein MC7420_6878 [Coleofasciculus chthonoplastes PCC 7420]
MVLFVPEATVFCTRVRKWGILLSFVTKTGVWHNRLTIDPTTRSKQMI